MLARGDSLRRVEIMEFERRDHELPDAVNEINARNDADREEGRGIDDDAGDDERDALFRQKRGEQPCAEASRDQSDKSQAGKFEIVGDEGRRREVRCRARLAQSQALEPPSPLPGFEGGVERQIKDCADAENEERADRIVAADERGQGERGERQRQPISTRRF